MKIVMDDYGLSIKQIFFIWLIMYLLISVPKFIIWTPHQLPPKIETDDEYSIMANSVLLNLCKKASNSIKNTENVSETEEVIKPKLSYKTVLCDVNFFLCNLGNIVFILRRSTYVAWLGSGWPEWVAAEGDPYQSELSQNPYYF